MFSHIQSQDVLMLLIGLVIGACSGFLLCAVLSMTSESDDNERIKNG